MKQYTRLRNFVFTFNNYTDNDYVKILNSDIFKYVIIGKEVGESGTPHLQGYAELKKQKRLSSLKKDFGDSIHLEPRKGNAKQAAEYCKKEGNWEEKGTMSHQGTRNDLISIKEKVLNDVPMHTILFEDCENFQQMRCTQILTTFKQQKNTYKKKEVFWLWGSTGTGKTKRAFEIVGDKSFWISSDNLKWFDGYSNQEIAIFDDFRKDFCTLHYLLRLLDGYPLRVPIKGGFVEWAPETIIITCPFTPGKVYETNEALNQLFRRITNIEHFLEVDQQ